MRGILRLSAVRHPAGPSRVARVHRTTTTATLLVTVAVSALSGCTTVQRPPVPGPSAAPSQPPAPRPDGRRETQIVQAPAREALELIGPSRSRSRSPEPTATTSRRAAPAAPAPERKRPSDHQDRGPRSAHPESRRPEARHPQRPHIDIPDVSESVRRDVQRDVDKSADVCALGRKYGGWRADSPEATICRQTYGR
ncbi:hypothetical protein GCM10027074_69280 [Streptomyces deserti]